jgi:hypothetical protein
VFGRRVGFGPGLVLSHPRYRRNQPGGKTTRCPALHLQALTSFAVVERSGPAEVHERSGDEVYSKRLRLRLDLHSSFLEPQEPMSMHPPSELSSD